MPQIFFSYARPDSEFAEKLANDLRSAGVSPWFDQHDILPGERWDSAVQNALKTSPWLLVVLSPHSVASENVMDEVAEALKLGKKVVPVLHLQCDVPFRIARLQYIDFTASYESGMKQLLRIAGAPQPMAAGLTAAPPTYLIDATAGHPPVRSSRLKQMLAAASLAVVAVVVVAAGIWGVVWFRSSNSRTDTVPVKEECPTVQDESGQSAGAKQPSWCRTQSSCNSAEYAICKSPALWPLEAELNRAYEAAAAQQIDTKVLTTSQGHWVHGMREPCGSDQTCLKGAYQSRIEALRRMQRA
jgi:hypothetical protein